ncbi:hypothetical protein L211DRAFT_853749 [Terfezia boudieri ATCC MYA-4762]|uniref:DDE Tnp4 domain-containing protein n=1 Tax=Terfezia boudieri ATCC MYA-4762 TaxID=1051890 RepID=A0A3N4L7K0_9PEZI|nr:hypothetical protein L211DRAFT_853749 [Terfezia boudieri ATCC MYA-4762]
MGHTAATHDSTAFKNSKLYKNYSSYFKSHEYLLANKAYRLEKYIIIPFKEPYAREYPKAAFNYQLSITRVKIEYTFRILKARFPSLRSLPIRIGLDQKEGHQCIIIWISACLVLHNWLNSIENEKEWLEMFLSSSTEEISQAESRNEHTEETTRLEARAGKIRRDELLNRVTEIIGVEEEGF